MGTALGRSYFHLHLVSDFDRRDADRRLARRGRAISGRRLDRACLSAGAHASQLDRVIAEIDNAPGIVLFTLVDPDLSRGSRQPARLPARRAFPCSGRSCRLFKSYLGQNSTPRAGAQHMLNAEYFKRIDALNFTMMCDDGQMPENLEHADIVLLGRQPHLEDADEHLSRQSRLQDRQCADRPAPALPGLIDHLRRPLIVGLVASAERIIQIRQNRLLSLNADPQTDYVDRIAVAEEIAGSRRLFAERNWPTIDVTRRSIEETAAAILDLYREHRLKFIAQA